MASAKVKMKRGMTEGEALAEWHVGMLQQVRGEIATEIANEFLAKYSAANVEHIERAIADLFQMRKASRFRRYVLVLLAQIDEHAHNRGATVRKRIHSVSNSQAKLKSRNPDKEEEGE
jgi:hypothetical protein